MGNRRFDDGQGQGDILKRGEGIQQIEILKNKSQLFPPEPGKLFGVQGGDIVPLNINMPSGHRVDGGNTIEQGGLSASRSAHNPHVFPLFHFKADVVHRLGDVPLIAVIFFHMLYT